MASVANSPQLSCALCSLQGDDTRDDLIILSCSHALCAGCVNRTYMTPRTDGAGNPIRDTHQTACPFCRSNSIHHVRITTPRLLTRGNPTGRRIGVVQDDRPQGGAG
jgi:hypothetical protein